MVVKHQLTPVTMHRLRQWELALHDYGVVEDLARQYIKYASPLIAAGLPVIFGVTHLAALTGIEHGAMLSMLNATQKHYRNFNLKKKRGGRRSIDAPYPTILYAQRWILDNILYNIEPHFSAHGFRKKRNILTNERIHLGAENLLSLDLRDFFPSISEERIIALFRSVGYSPKVSFSLATLCCLDGKLPQGAATSPYLSNLICRKLDARLWALARHERLSFTRYADDISISGSAISNRLIHKAILIIQEEGLSLNEEKFRFSRQGQRKIVTGLDVTGRHVKPTRSFRRELLKDIYYIKKFGLYSHTKKEKITDPFFKESIRGRINFWRQISPKTKIITEASEAMRAIGI